MDEHKNQLFPVFIKLNEKRVLIIGGGTVALEKLQTVLKNSPETSIRVVSKEFCPELIDLSHRYKKVFLFHKAYHKNDLLHSNLVIAAVGDNKTSATIRRDCLEAGILLNSADKPAYCDFYLGGVVTRGDLKIAISTNGKSPLMARRMREFFEKVIPEDLISKSIEDLSVIRQQVKGTLKQKLKILNKITQNFVQ